MATDKFEEAFLKVNKFVMSPGDIIEDENYQATLEAFNHDCNHCLKEWQYWEWPESFNDRYELDKEAYMNRYCSPSTYPHPLPFDEERFIKQLIESLSLAKHDYFEGYKEHLISRLSNKSKRNNNRIKSINPDNFNDLFLPEVNPYIYVKLLREVEPQLIDDNHNYIPKRNKQAFAAWIDALKEKGGVIHNIKDREVLRDLICQKFKMSMDESLFGKLLGQRARKYKDQFKKLLP